MRKLLILYAVILLMLLGAAVLPDYYINYSVYISFSDSLNRFEWLIFAGILGSGVLLSGVLALVPFKKIPYANRLLSVNIFFNTAFLFFISYHGIRAITDFQKEYEDLSVRYKTRAESDIRNGVIIYETAGLGIGLDSAEQAKENKVDSLRRSYGIAYTNTGCMISAPVLRAQADYEELTASYLDQRNGPGWRDRMDLQIQKIRTSRF